MLNNENRYLFRFAWKSILRNAGRSFFISFSVSLSVVIAIWVVSFFDGMNSQIEESVVNTNVGFYQLQDPLYARTTDSSAPVPFTTDIKEKLISNEIKSYSPELVLDANISTPEGAAGLTVLGIDPARHKEFLPVYQKIIQGSFITDTDEGGAVIGEELAKIFKFKVGDQMVLNYQDDQGELRSELLQIRGIYDFNGKGFEKKYVYITQKTWQNVFFHRFTGQDLFNRIVIRTKSFDHIKETRSRFKDSNLVLKSWKNVNPEMAVVLDFHHGMITFFFVIIAVTILMTILTPVQMLWQERFKELKMMTVLGVSVKKFWKLGLFEVIQMIFCSFFFSTIAIILIIGTQSHTGVDFRFLNKDGVSIERAGIQLPGIIYPILTGQQIIYTFAFVIFVLSVSYVWSLYRTLGRFKVEQ